MKKLFVSLFVFHSVVFYCAAQELPVSTEQQLEDQTDAEQGETEDDAWLQELEHFKKDPLDLNAADADKLRELSILTDLQISNLLTYRKLTGKLISVYELQAVPGWDIGTIKRILPYITIGPAVTLQEDARKRFSKGEHSLLARISQIAERSKGYDSSQGGPKYLGSPQRIFFRYRYVYKDLLQFGITGDKDAGEQFFKGNQRMGFDFYSVHFFIRKIGIIRSLALGDFTVNMGQGLIQWQGLAFKKSAEAMAVKRQSAVLRPYNSAGEFYFHRGAGITIRKGCLEATAFASIRKLSANFSTDTLTNEDFVSSFLTSGYNRSANEIADKNKLTQITFGGVLAYQGNKWHIGLNGIQYIFSLPVHKRDDPYNLYAIRGTHWSNYSIDYSYTYKNLHLFGEMAIDKDFKKGLLNGLMISVDPRVDISIVQRSISKEFQSINGNAFTENTTPSNEKGLYAGITIRPGASARIDAYADVYQFPWLKFQVDAPSRGSDYLVQFFYSPNKQVEIYTRFRREARQQNQSGGNTATNSLVFLPRQSWRVHISIKKSKAIALRNRVELLWYNNKGRSRATGFLTYFDLLDKPMLRPYSLLLRLQYFETGDYNARIYAYENDILFSYSIPSFSGQGFRYYLTYNRNITKRLNVWLRWSQTLYRNSKSIGSGADEISGNSKTEAKLEFIYYL